MTKQQESSSIMIRDGKVYLGDQLIASAGIGDKRLSFDISGSRRVINVIKKNGNVLITNRTLKKRKV